MILGTDRLNVDNFSVDRPKAIEQAANIGDHWLDPWAMALATFHLHIDNDETGRLWIQFDLGGGHQRSSGNYALTRLFHAKLAIVTATTSESGLCSIGKKIRLADFSIPREPNSFTDRAQA